MRWRWRTATAGHRRSSGPHRRRRSRSDRTTKTTLTLVWWMLMLACCEVCSGYGDKGKAAAKGHAQPPSNDLLSGNAAADAANMFTTRNNSRVIAQRGGLAILPCAIRWTGNPSATTVSWIRRRDFQLLTVGLSTYSSDERFLVEHARHMGHWSLRIKSVRDDDRGLYECQLSTHPIRSIFIDLRVVEAVADIVGAPDVHIDEGSSLRLECILKRATENPSHIFWYHNGKMINYDQQSGYTVSSVRLSLAGHQQLPHHSNNMTLSPGSSVNGMRHSQRNGAHDATGNGGGISDFAKVLATTSNLLTIDEVSGRHAGNYTCAPSNARPISVNVHVLRGDKPAAMQHGNRSSSSSGSRSDTSASICRTWYAYAMASIAIMAAVLA